MSADPNLLAYVSRLGDNALILGQRMIEAVALYPELEEELANANFALDYIGQARLFYSYAAELEGKDRTEDDLRVLRDGHEYRNCLLLEQPNGHFRRHDGTRVPVRVILPVAARSAGAVRDSRTAEIAARAVKEIRYHLRHVSQWVVRLGDGTDESHDKMQQAIDDHWRFTGELFAADEIDTL